ncbi:hypothetical protein DICSQDRAFT_58071, partial [Dichomitus squalens LYAD-421 SS1]|uniref:uncharacterized protein n=1 Tax=Dichomitus squalens (strain LYAD-421) TaxID=732165 RepID=UPI0004412C7F
SYHDVDDFALVPTDVIPRDPADCTIELKVSFDTMADGTNHAMFNGTTYNSPLVPAIMSKMSLGQNASIAGAYGPTSFVLDHLTTFDIVLKNGDAGKQPLCVLLRFESLCILVRET